MTSRQLIAFLKQLNRVAQAPHSREKLLGHKIPSKDKVLLSFGQAPSRLLRKRINILVWNMYKAKKKGWADDLISLASNKDIILLQEAYLRPVMKKLLAQTSLFQWDLAQGFQRGGNKVAAGVMTGSISRPREVFFFALRIGNPWSRLPRWPLVLSTKSTTAIKISWF